MNFHAALMAVLFSLAAVARAEADAPPPAAASNDAPPAESPPQDETPAAAQAPPASEAAASAAATPPVARDASVTTASPGRRIVGVLFGAAAGGVGGAALGLFGGGFRAACALFNMANQGCLPFVFFVFPVGGLIGAPVGAWLFGDWLEGQGTYLGALLGGAIGAAIALPLAALSMFGILDARMTLVLPIAGAMIGYERSHARNRAAASAPKLTALPFLVPGGGGGVALAGVL